MTAVVAISISFLSRSPTVTQQQLLLRNGVVPLLIRMLDADAASAGVQESGCRVISSLALCGGVCVWCLHRVYVWMCA